MPTTIDVVDQHLQSFLEQDLDRLLADYATDAVLFMPGSKFEDPAAIRAFFLSLSAEFAKPGAWFTVHEQSVTGDYACISWSAETADNTYELATDTFVVRNGKIVAQSFEGKIIPKH